MSRGLGSLQRGVLDVLRRRELPGMAAVMTPEAIMDDLALAGRFEELSETHVRSVRRALAGLWDRGLVDKSLVSWAGRGADVRAGQTIWRIHDDARPPDPDESTWTACGTRLDDSAAHFPRRTDPV